MKLADHPTSRLTAFPGLHSARRLQNRVYFGYGNWNEYCAVTLASYDPLTNVLAVEHSVASDSVDMIREIDGTIYVPHIDPSHHEDYHDYSYRGPDGRWLQSAAMELLHVFDFAKSGSLLVCAGNRGLHYSENEGRTWNLLTSAADRQYWCFDYNGTIYSQAGRSINGKFQLFPNLPFYLNHTTPFRDTVANADLVLGLDNKSPGGSGFSNHLLLFDGTAIRQFKSQVRSFTTQGAEVFVLIKDAIQKTSNPAASPAVFSTLDITGIPSTASCLELLDGKFYIGTTKGEIWVANADGTATTVVPPTVENQIPDSYGRGLAFSGDSLLVGAPNALAATFLAGKAELWSRRDKVWQSQREWEPPAPDFSGWFGRDVALHGDLMAVVEAGQDKSNMDRGANAKVHVHQLIDGTWTPQAVFEVAFAQSVAIQGDMMVVGTSNQAANQAAGLPGVIPYSITRDAGHLAVLTPLPQMKASFSSAYGYKSLVRVALMGDLLVVSYSGDPGRGSTGAMEVYRRDGAGFATKFIRNVSVSSLQRYGFGLAAHSGVIAVGAPFEDTEATNSGAVFLYENWVNGEVVRPFVQKQVLRAPVPQAHGEFGAAVAMHDGLLLVGSPGREVNGARQRGAVYKYRRQASGTWVFAGEIVPPSASDTEFGIEVACNDRWLAAGSLGCAAGATGLTSRVRVIPRSGYEEWLDARLITTGRQPTDDADADGLPTLLEYTSNLPPDQPARSDAAMAATEPAGLPALGEADAGGMRPLTFVRPVNDSRILMTVESSSDLVKWTEDPAKLEVVASGTTHELVRIHVSGEPAERWWRVRAAYDAE
ncbi:MAG: hypothetical protein V4726_14435 [Verrucomicrobiota bacterium]